MPRCRWFRCRFRPEEVITLLCSTSFVVCVTAKVSSGLDRVALCALQLRVFLDLDLSSFCFVWILPSLEVLVEQVQKEGIRIKDKVDGVVAIRFKVTGTNLRDEVRVLRGDSY